MSILPKGYVMTEPKNGGNYEGKSLFLNKFKEGNTKVRILEGAFIGYSWWVNKKPMRCRRIDEVPSNIPQGGMNGYKEFWAFKVYNHTEDCIQLMEVTSQQVKSGIYTLDVSEDWGDVKNYDIVIQRTGMTKDDTEYKVVPVPTKPLPEKAIESDKKVSIDWDKFFNNENPIVIDGKVKEGNGKMTEEVEAKKLSDEPPF